jgi:hypothetical protein
MASRAGGAAVVCFTLVLGFVTGLAAIGFLLVEQ